jgi:hypothetical protein
MSHIKTPDLMHFCSGGEYYNAAVAHAWHKTVNSRFKNKQVLVNHFRHFHEFHLSCFRAVAVVTELIIESKEYLFPVEITDKGLKTTKC